MSIYHFVDFNLGVEKLFEKELTSEKDTWCTLRLGVEVI